MYMQQFQLLDLVGGLPEYQPDTDCRSRLEPGTGIA